MKIKKKQYIYCKKSINNVSADGKNKVLKQKTNRL